MFDLFLWWLILSLIGWGAFPLAFHFFRALPGRGYAFTKALGWLVVGFAFWFLAALGLIQNTFGAIALIVVVVLAAVWWFGRRADANGTTPLAWLRAEWKFALVVEIVFLVSFLAFAYYRAYNPQIDSTEKPMEFMFLNSILRSETFPPHDAWLSGFAISYYYFGYVLVALLTKLSGIPSSITFNLGLTTVFALGAIGAFGLGYALALNHPSPARGRGDGGEGGNLRASYFVGVLAIFFLLVVGNLEGAVESLHSAGALSPATVASLDVNNLDGAPVSGSFIPSDNWWWWRASRVVNDHDPRTGGHVEVIDEFPFFSFLLGDLHPHVLALPFTLLGLALAFEIFLVGQFAKIVPAEGASSKSPNDFSVTLATESLWRIFLAALIIGAFGFLNSWDLPTYGFVAVAAFALAQFQQRGFSRAALIESAKFAVALGALSIILYLPFYIGFQSQARGLMPVVPFKTPLQQYLLMFGLFVFVLAFFIGALVKQNVFAFTRAWSDALTYALLLVLIPIVIGVGILVVVGFSTDLQNQIASLLPINLSGNIARETVGYYVNTILARPWLSLVLMALIVGAGVLIRLRVEPNQPADVRPSSVTFALLLALTGFLLTFGVEYVYILDTFGTRMNTVFKLYYQAWTLFAIASAFGVYYLWRMLSTVPRAIFVTAFAILFAASMVYPVLAAPNRANNFHGDATLDGMAFVQRFAPDEYAAIQWLNTNAPNDAIILEGSGPEYSDWNRFSMATGLPTVLGWAGHELQWRGNNDEANKRLPDIEQIYKSLDVNQTRTLLAKYNIRYVIVTPREQQKYALASVMIDKFKRIGKSVFAQGNVQIFQVQ